MRELLELQYEFQEPFIVDSTKIATKLDVHATPLDQALADTIAATRPRPAKAQLPMSLRTWGNRAAVMVGSADGCPTGKALRR